MEAKVIKTLTGDWFEIGEFVEADFEIEMSEVRYEERKSSYEALLTIKLKQEPSRRLKEIFEDAISWNRFVTYMPLSFYVYSTLSSGATTDLCYFVRISENVRLRGVRRDETKRARHAEAREAAEAKAKLSSSWTKSAIAAFLARTNEGIARFLEYTHNRILGNLDRALGWDSEWVKHIDDKIDVSVEKEEIESINAAIEVLEAKRDEANARLRKKRGAAWVEKWEESGWVWAEDVMPEPWIERTKELVKEDKAFRQRSNPFLHTM